VSRQATAVRSREGVIKLFEVFDPEFRGYVTTGEFRAIMGKLGELPIPTAVLDELIAYADPDDTGQVQYDVFADKLFADYATWEHNLAAAKAAAAAGVGGKGKK